MPASPAPTAPAAPSSPAQMPSASPTPSRSEKAPQISKTQLEQNPFEGEHETDQGDDAEAPSTLSGAPAERTETTQTESAGQAEPASVPSSGLTAEQFKQVLSETIMPRLEAPQQAAPQRQMTPEEFNQTMNIVSVTPEMCQELGLAPEVAPKLNAFAQAIAKQAMTVAAYHQEMKMRELQLQFSPIQHYMAQQQEVQLRKQYMDQNPQFEGMEPLLEHVYKAMVSEGFRADTAPKLFAEVTKRADTLMKQLNLTPKGQAAASAAPQRGTPTPGKSRMSPLASGGQGGTGKGTETSEQQRTAKWLFGNK